MIVRLMLTPISDDASRSIEVVRIARPVRVREMKSCRATIKITELAITKRFKRGTRDPETWIDHSIGTSWGTVTMVGPKKNWMTFCKIKLTPMAVMSGASFGARRSGRYARRSISAPSRAITPIVSAKSTSTLKPRSGTFVMLPSLPKRLLLMNMATKEPTMKTSPWAKLISSMMP